MVEKFISFRPHAKTAGLIHLANEVIEKLALAGYSLTLRQLYYQLVALDVIPNKQTEYKRLGEILNSARLGGLVDWDAIEDRTRNLKGLNHYQDPSDIIGVTSGSFRMDKWKDQPHRIEVWVEKDALVQVIQKACTPFDVDYFSCRGYTSQSEVYGASKRLLRYMEDGQKPIIIHLGDHDPSGIDMTRDIIDRINLFHSPYGFEEIEVERIALNMSQVKEYNPPPNPAKQTDSRFKDYKRKHGVNCWELDALNPKVIDSLITKKITSYLDDDKWDKAVSLEDRHRSLLRDCATRWPEVERLLTQPPKPPRKPRAKRLKKKTKPKPKQS